MMPNFWIVITINEINGVINEVARALIAKTYAARKEVAYAIGTDVIRRLYPIDPMTIGGYMMVLKYYQDNN